MIALFRASRGDEVCRRAPLGPLCLHRSSPACSMLHRLTRAMEPPPRPRRHHDHDPSRIKPDGLLGQSPASTPTRLEQADCDDARLQFTTPVRTRAGTNRRTLCVDSLVFLISPTSLEMFVVVSVLGPPTLASRFIFLPAFSLSSWLDFFISRRCWSWPGLGWPYQLMVSLWPQPRRF